MNITDTEKANDNRNFGLDLFRAIAIILVVKSHGSFLIDNSILKNLPTLRFIDGVDLFFVLSGFLIGRILLKEINSKTEFGLRQLTNFWKRRWYRTLPNYYLILIANYIIIYYKFIPDDINKLNWKFLFFLQNFSHYFFGPFWESWSLSIEEWFYIISPISLLLLLKILKPKISFATTFVLMIFASFLYRVSIYDETINDFGLFDATYRKIVLGRLDSIAYGLLASWIFYYYNIFWAKLRISSFLIGTCLIIFILNYNTEYNTFYKQVVVFSISPIAAMLLLPFVYSLKAKKNKITNVITHISKISYSMYLINLALIAQVIQYNFAAKNEIDAALKYGLYWILVIMCSTILYHYFEKPILKLRDR